MFSVVIKKRQNNPKTIFCYCQIKTTGKWNKYPSHSWFFFNLNVELNIKVNLLESFKKHKKSSPQYSEYSWKSSLIKSKVQLLQTKLQNFLPYFVLKEILRWLDVFKTNCFMPVRKNVSAKFLFLLQSFARWVFFLNCTYKFYADF